MGIKIEFTTREAEAVLRILKKAEREAEDNWNDHESVTNRFKFETIESARIRVAQKVPA